MDQDDENLPGMSVDQLTARVEFLQQSIDCLRDELDDVEAEIDRRAAA